MNHAVPESLSDRCRALGLPPSMALSGGLVLVTATLLAEHPQTHVLRMAQDPAEQELDVVVRPACLYKFRARGAAARWLLLGSYLASAPGTGPLHLIHAWPVDGVGPPRPGPHP